MQHFLFRLYYLIKGLDIARTVRINHVGWAMTKDLRFFLSLQSQHKQHKTILHQIDLGTALVNEDWKFRCLIDPLFLCPPTFCQSFGNISWASWFRASYCEEWLRSCRWSGNLQPPASPGCWPRSCRRDTLARARSREWSQPWHTHRKRFSMM